MFNKSISFKLEDISTYRSELMGWAILWIMALHFTFTQIKPIGFIAQYGFAGVDIFMLVSGLGLYYSLDNNHQIGTYYQKRVVRIFPTYYLIGIIPSTFLLNDNFTTYLFRYTTLGYWIGAPYEEWYVPAIIFLYIIAPFIKKAFDYQLFAFITFLTIATLLSAYYLIDKTLLDRIHFFLLYRIPAFILGMACAYWIKNKETHNYFLWLLAGGIPFFIIFFPRHHEFYNYKYFSLLFLMPFFTISFVLLSKSLRFLTPIISMIGKASLEIYLIQHIFFYAKITGIMPINSNLHDTISILLIIGCSILGLLLHWLFNNIGINKLSKIKNNG